MTNADQAGPAGQHFDAKGKLPSSYTIDLQKALRRSLPFEDQRDFEEAQRGFLAAPEYKQILAEAGHVAWDMGSYEFLLRGFDSVFDSIHPSLQRQAVLNMAYGLYEVLPDRIYQVRGFDLANMTIIKGQTGGSCLTFSPARRPREPRSILSISSLARGRLWRLCIPTATSTISAVSVAWCQKKMSRVARCRFLALLSS